MRKYRVFLTAMILAVLLTACGGSQEPAAEEKPQTVQEDPEAKPEAGSVDTEEEGEAAEAPKPSEADSRAPEPLEASEPAAESAAPDTIPEGTKTETVYATSRVNIRTAPSTEAEIYGTLGVRQTAERVEDDGTWSKIALDGHAYYVASEYLEAKPVRSAGGGSGESNGCLVVIDAGHQQKGNSEKEPIGPGASETKAKVAGGTSGAASGLKEYELTLQVAQKLEEILKERGYDVLMVRTSNDVNISNAERAAVANDAGADAFIRIHANGSEDGSVNGAMTICQTPSNPYNGGLYSQSRLLSDCVLDAFVEKTGAKKQYVWETDTMSGINWASVPTTIIEMGYMTNQTEDLNMASGDYQYLMAEGMAEGIERFLGTE